MFLFGKLSPFQAKQKEKSTEKIPNLCLPSHLVYLCEEKADQVLNPRFSDLNLAL